MNYSQRILFEDWIARCPIEGVIVDKPTEVIKEGDKLSYLLKIFLMIDKEDWEHDQPNPGNEEIFKNFENIQDFEKKQGSVWL